MRIGIISTTQGLDWAATDEVWSQFAAHALANGHEVSVSAHRLVANSPRLEALRKQGLILFDRRPFRPTRAYLLKEKIISEMASFERLNHDLVLFNGGSVQDPFYQPNLAYFCERSKNPIVFLCHGHSEDYQIHERERLASFLSQMAGMVFVSEENRKTLETQLAMNFCNSVVIRNSPTVFLDSPLPWPEERSVRFACVARLEAFWKGHETLLRVLSEPCWLEREWHLDIYGKGSDEQHIRNVIGHFSLNGRVSLRGHVDDIVEVWNKSHALLLASRAESLSLAILEAMMCGRVVVSTDVGDNRHAIKEEQTGFLADAGTPYSFGKAMQRAWQVQNIWPSIGESAHTTAKTLANESPALQLLSYLTTVLEDKKG